MFSLSGFELYSIDRSNHARGYWTGNNVQSTLTELLIICNGLKAEVTMPATVMF